MEKGIILYQSKYGATKKYADWLREAAQYACVETKRADIRKVQGYDTIILGGGIYASGIAGLSFLKKHIQVLQDKNIAVFCVGSSPCDEAAFSEIYEHITPAVKYRSFYLSKFPSAALDFLVVATTTPSKIRLADENLFCVKFSDI